MQICLDKTQKTIPPFFSFEVKEVLPFPSEDELRAHTAIPNIVFPSDHIACFADLRWKDKGKKEEKT